MKNLNSLIEQIKRRHNELEGSSRENSFLLHLETMGSWEQEANWDTSIETPTFPETINIAFAICHPDCGAAEFIVDGSTQECQKCGRLMFRTAVHKYRKL